MERAPGPYSMSPIGAKNGRAPMGSGELGSSSWARRGYGEERGEVKLVPSFQPH